MASSIINWKKCRFFMKDGSATPNTLELSLGDGTCTWTVANNYDYKLDRGNLDVVRQGDDVPLEINIDSKYTFLRATTASGNPPTPYEFAMKIGPAEDYVSTDADDCAPWAFDLVMLYQPDCGTETKSEKVTFPDFRPESIECDPKNGTIKMSGKCNITQPDAERTDSSTI